jgi:hypothetical protein
VPKNSAQKLVPVEEREYRLVIDLRYLNSVVNYTDQDSTQILGSAEIYQKIAHIVKTPNPLYSVIDIKSFYHSLPVTEPSKNIFVYDRQAVQYLLTILALWDYFQPQAYVQLYSDDT